MAERERDQQLVGYWSDEPLYQGAMESADVAFRADGTGWMYWSRSGGPFEVVRFGWHTRADRQLAIRLRQRLSGTWYLVGQAVRHRVLDRAALTESIALTYDISGGQNVRREPATLLTLSQRLRLGTIGDRFAYQRALAPGEDDPATIRRR